MVLLAGFWQMIWPYVVGGLALLRWCRCVAAVVHAATRQRV
jgi:hypothetical protein